MRHVAALFLLAALALPAGAQTPRSIDNPVLDGVADSGVLKYNGDYYIMGVGTGGDMYTSADLVRWRGPRHAFSMNNEWTPGPAAQDRRIHACDFEYTGGVFHLYWSVNYWGEPQMAVRIGHATADSVLGPYREPVTSTWFDSRIDPHLFVDDDGTPYFYSVKFADGNVIYGQKMKDPWTRVGEPQFLLSALPGTWETRAERIIEGAEVDKHRGRYYMLYAANHVASRWGQYAIGAAEADHPLGFNNASKYDHPVVGPTNEERITENANVIVPIGEATWRYRTSAPGDGWTQASYDESDWRSGRTAFGNHDVDNSTTYRTETRWESPELWLRKRFRLAEAPSEHVQLLMRLRGAADVYVNGERIYRSDGARNYATVDVDDVSAFREGENVLAVHARQHDDRQYVDVGLLDPQDAPGEKYVFSPGQPNLVRGPNGFSWWLVYFARFDGTGKSQTIDRAYFFDQKLHVDGPTSRRTPGYHPPPRSPTFGDRFERQDRLGASWRVSGGRWRTRGGEALQRSMDTSTRATPDEPESQRAGVDVPAPPGRQQNPPLVRAALRLRLRRVPHAPHHQKQRRLFRRAGRPARAGPIRYRHRTDWDGTPGAPHAGGPRRVRRRGVHARLGRVRHPRDGLGGAARRKRLARRLDRAAPDERAGHAPRREGRSDGRLRVQRAGLR
ncbi:MAG: hypothetical protein BRD45_02960 [Bacteroidetes bacterium QS_8_64_10]|nr:MAG: hypothetical protein BRD45_02960 [Bacteroidetes bacterium QS_8_64_10]